MSSKKQMCSCDHHRDAHNDNGQCQVCDCESYWSPESRSPPPSQNPSRTYNWTDDEWDELRGK